MSLLNYSRFFKQGYKMNTINYDKYSTMSIKQLISALNNAEKKQAKIKEKLLAVSRLINGLSQSFQRKLNP